MLDERERAGAHHVLLVPAHVLRQDVGLEDPAVRRGQRHEERRLRPLEPEADGLGVGRLDGLHGAILPLAIRRRLGRGEDDLVVAGLRVARGHEAAVVEAHARPQLQRVREPIGRDCPRLREVGNHLGARAVERVDAQQRVVVRRQRVDDAEGALLVAVVGRWLGGHEVDQLAAGARLVLGEGGRQQCESDDRGGHQGRVDSCVHGSLIASAGAGASGNFRLRVISRRSHRTRSRRRRWSARCAPSAVQAAGRRGCSRKARRCPPACRR